MKTRFTLISVALATALNCAAVSAQVLGGGGGLGGTLSGGMRDMGVMTRGTMNGSLGADIDTSTLRRTTRDTADRTTNRVRNTASTARDRVTSKAIETRDVATTTASDAAATAVHEIDKAQIEGAADVAGSAASSVSRDSLNVAGDAQGAANVAGSAASSVSRDSLNVASDAQGAANVAGSAASSVSRDSLNLAGDAQGAANGGLTGAETIGDAQGAATGAADGNLVQKPQPSEQGTAKAPVSNATQQTDQPAAVEPATVAQPSRALNVSSAANGSASASRESGLLTQGGGSANVSRN